MITEHEMLVTLANMALKMNDLTGEDVLDTFRQLGYQSVVEEARELGTPPAMGVVDSAASALREPVQWFADRMEAKLRLNDHKGHWSNCGFPYLDRRLDDKVYELKHARSNLNYGGMIEEAVDVANFALMIADNARRKI